MIWLAWRQQRLESIIALIVLGLTAVVFVPSGLSLSRRFDDDELAACAPSAAAVPDRCGRMVERFVGTADGLSGAMNWFGLVPLLVAILFASPLVLELERGSYRLAWTQSITRRRWVVTRFCVIFASAAIASGVLAGIWSWWRIPLNALKGRIEPTSFQVLGLAPVAYTLLATAIVVAVGAITRRTIATIGLSIVAFLALRISVETWLRPHFEPALAGPSAPDSAWVLDRRTSGADAVRVVFQPDWRFWHFQLLESGLFLMVAVLLTCGAAAWILRRFS